MFYDCDNLQTIYVGNGWTTALVTGYNSVSLFYGCSNLVGGKGTAYNDSNPTDTSYAHIDGGPNNPGYFTEEGTEAYACYTSSNTTLTFYFDKLRSSRSGKTYDALNTDRTENVAGWLSDYTYRDVTNVVFDPSFANARPRSTCDWFYNMDNLESIEGMNYLNTSMVTSMGSMFEGCVRLTRLDLSSFNTSKVTNMSYMFDSCKSLTSLDLSSFSTSSVQWMDRMFDTCTNLQTIYVGSGWSTEAVVFSIYMFYKCSNLMGRQGTTYDADHVDADYAHIDGGPSNPGYFTEPPEAYANYTPSNATLTFYYDNLRSTRPGTTYNLNRVGDTPSWVNDGKNAYVTKVVFDPLFADARPTSTYGWFYQMENLQTIEGLSYLNTSEVTDMTYMFGYCKKLTSLDLSNFNTSKVSDMRYMFYSCLNLQTIIVGKGWSTAAVTSSSNMFMGCRVLVGGKGTNYDVNHVNRTYAHIDGGPSNPGYFTAAGTEPYACYTPGNTTLTFYYDNLRGSRGGTTYDLNLNNNYPRWTSNGTYENVTKVVFDSSFAGARPTTTYAWFYGMENLTNITGMSYLNTSKVTNMNQMFYYCSSLKSRDICHFNTSEVTDMGYMFMLCNNLQTIYVGNGWNTAKVTQSTNMFSNCTSLKGGKGTTYNDSNPKDKSYAHIDGGSSDPGYFRDINTGIATDLHQVTSDKQQVQSDEWYKDIRTDLDIIT